ncbi:MAG TPA: 23S rRNA (adenine(2030)-N(6))-methyltransferase RlmJ, partial [Alphaproteobacteria bacterium]|nr:23S rRNA (adenine(2030)-N(6))-methyltransferase RlmJ [Alphaproteobacteria bacterium]
KPFCIFDTHAGMGRYDMRDPRAEKTNEAQEGIQTLLAAPHLPELTDYYDVISDVNMKGPMRYYPGSPLIASKMLRPGDRLICCELHKDDFHELRRLFENNSQVQVHYRNGYEALRAFLPPPEKRGLVLIDPPFEQPDEFNRIVEAIEAYQRWPQGTYVIWYPIKERPALWRFHEVLAATGIPKQLCAEFVYQEETRHDRLNGCGLIIINPPWKFDEKLNALFSALHEAMKTPYRGTSIKWLTPE